jgi:aspartate/methionine/tyrosine aminotransferase
VPITVRAQPPGWHLDESALAAAFTPRTRLLVYNSPHNPTGHTYSRDELGVISRLCSSHNVLAIADEVYEGKTWGGTPELRLRDAPGMAERTITVGSASKLLSLTGWRVGWAIAPSALLDAPRALHSYVTYCAPTPLQLGVAAALRVRTAASAAARAAGHAQPRDPSAPAFQRSAEVLTEALSGVGLTVYPVQGGYFLIADVSATGLTGGEYCKQLIATAAVASVPMEIFYAPGDAPPPRSLVRFAICKTLETVTEAARRIRAFPLPLMDAVSR